MDWMELAQYLEQRRALVNTGNESLASIKCSGIA